MKSKIKKLIKENKAQLTSELTAFSRHKKIYLWPVEVASISQREKLMTSIGNGLQTVCWDHLQPLKVCRVCCFCVCLCWRGKSKEPRTEMNWGRCWFYNPWKLGFSILYTINNYQKKKKKDHGHRKCQITLTSKIPFPGNSTQWFSSDGFLLPAEVLKLVLFDWRKVKTIFSF